MLYELRIVGNCNNNSIHQIQREVYSRPEATGTYELYDQLYVNRYCRSYSKTRIYYVAYTLASNNIDFKISEIDN